jgi:hypothetical protein
VATFERKMEIYQIDENTSCSSCTACVWPGIEVPPNSYQQALDAFQLHACTDSVNVYAIQGKLSAW